MKHLNRREFIQLTATAIGGIMLTGCGGGGGSGRVPSGYRFYRLKENGAVVDGAGTAFQIDRFYGSAHISSNGIVSFDAIDSAKRRGLFQIGVETGGYRPKVAWERSALLVGDCLEDGRVVSTCKAYDVDDDGNIAAVIDADVRYSEQHYGAGLYADLEQQGFMPVVVAGDELADGSVRSSGIFGDVSCVQGSIITDVHHLPADGYRSGSENSLIHIPDVTPTEARMLTSTGDLLGGTDHNVSAFGLIDHNFSGDYTVGVAAAFSDLSAAVNEVQSHFNVSGNVNYPNDIQLTSAPSGAAANDVTVVGEGGYGSRVGSGGEIFSLLDAGDQMNLIQDDQIVLATGDRVDNSKILAITTGSAGSDGLYYYTAVTETGGEVAMTLFVYDGFEHIPLLSSGDVLSDGSAPVEQILFGTTAKHVDDENRLVFFCSFADGTTSLVIGLPS